MVKASCWLETSGGGVTMVQTLAVVRQKEKPMNSEEMQKAMEFIVNQQGQASAKIDGILEAQKAGEERWKRAEERWTRTEEGIRALLSIAQIHEKEIQANTQQILSLGQKTSATDDRLNTLINIVERQISNSDGKP